MLSRVGDRCSLNKLVGIDAEEVVAQEELVDIPAPTSSVLSPSLSASSSARLGRRRWTRGAVTRGISVWSTRKRAEPGIRERA
jgi:hypothetical protein